MTARDNPPPGAATKFLQKILFFAFGPVSKAYALRSGNTEEASVKALIDAHAEGHRLGFLGKPVVSGRRSTWLWTRPATDPAFQQCAAARLKGSHIFRIEELRAG